MITRISNFLIQPIILCLLLYALSPYLPSPLGSPLLFLTGLPLIFFFPGNYTFLIFPKGLASLTIWGKLAIKATLSFAIFSSIMLAIGMVFPTYALTASSQIKLVIVVNLLIYSVYLLIKKPRTSSPSLQLLEFKQNLVRGNKLDLLTALFPLGVIFALYLIHPYAENNDGFLVEVKKIIETGFSSSATFRVLFTKMLAFLNFALFNDYLSLFRLAYVVLFWQSSLLFFDFCKRHIANKNLARTTYLLLFASSVIISEVNIMRPQVALLYFTLPILLLLTESLFKKNGWYALTALWLSVLAVGFHELSVFLIITSLASLAFLLYYGVRISKKIPLKYVLYGIVIALPYYKILPIAAFFSQASGITDLAFRLFKGLHFRWWFIDNYITIDGYNLGWPGIMSLYYYLYNGILVLALLILLLIISPKIRQKPDRGSYIAVSMYALIFLFFAEILPRVGLFFLPNRAWPHLMLAVTLLIALLYRKITSDKQAKFFTRLNILIIIFGVLGSLYVSRNNVGEVFKEEMTAEKFIATQTEKESLFLSTQANQTLVELYAHRNYEAIKVSQNTSKDQFENAISKKIEEVSMQRNTQISPTITQIVQTFEGEIKIKEEKNIIAAQKIVTEKQEYFPGKPVYFIYSKRKLVGINGQRNYLQTSIDASNKNNYPTFGYPIAYQDQNVSIYRVR